MLVTQIKNLPNRLPEIGKIKIGNKGETRTGSKGEYRLPQKLDHFIITTNEKDGKDDFIIDSELHAILGDEPKELKIRLLYNEPELNFYTRYSIFQGNKCICEGDGEDFYWLNEATGEMEAGKVPVKQLDPNYKGKDKCKPNGVLQCVIEGANTIGGVWKFRTTSWNSVVSIQTGLAFIRQLTGGQLAGVPLTLALRAKNVLVEGKSTKIYVVNIEYRGSIESLQETTYKLLTSTANYSAKLQMIEQNAMKQLKESPNDFDTDTDDVIAEFYPENQDNYEDVPVKRDELAELNEEEPKPNEKEIESKIAKAKLKAIAKVNKADTIEKLKELKAGIGFKEDFGSLSNVADEALADVIKIINEKIDGLQPKQEEEAEMPDLDVPETDETPEKSEHEKFADKLTELGLVDNELRQQFYAVYGNEKKYEGKNPSEDVETYKKRKLVGLIKGTKDKEGLIPAFIAKQSGEVKAFLAEHYKVIDRTNFDKVWDFYKTMTEGSEE